MIGNGVTNRRNTASRCMGFVDWWLVLWSASECFLQCSASVFMAVPVMHTICNIFGELNGHFGFFFQVPKPWCSAQQCTVACVCVRLLYMHANTREYRCVHANVYEEWMPICSKCYISYILIDKTVNGMAMSVYNDRTKKNKKQVTTTNLMANGRIEVMTMNRCDRSLYEYRYWWWPTSGILINIYICEFDSMALIFMHLYAE